MASAGYHLFFYPVALLLLTLLAPVPHQQKKKQATLTAVLLV